MCGKIDWIEYLPETESVKIIDFKTGKTEEDPNSLQLPIYYLLASNTQTRPVASMGYWYLDKDDTVIDMPLPDAEQAQKQVLEIAKRIMVARKLNQFSCKEGIDGCRDCRPLEKIVRGEAEFIGTGQYDKDVYIILSRDEEESVKEVETPF